MPVNRIPKPRHDLTGYSNPTFVDPDKGDGKTVEVEVSETRTNHAASPVSSGSVATPVAARKPAAKKAPAKKPTAATSPAKTAPVAKKPRAAAKQPAK